MAEKAKKSTKTKTTKSTNSKAAKTTRKSPSENTSKIICLIIGIIAIVAIIFAIVFAVKGATINDAYFVSDGSKLVINLDNDYDDNVVVAPIKSHLVYYYSGDKITGVKYYYEFSSNEKALEAYNELKSNDDFNESEIALNGKYIIFTFPSSQYEGTTVEDVKSYMQIVENGSGTTEIEAAEETVEE